MYFVRVCNLQDSVRLGKVKIPRIFFANVFPKVIYRRITDNNIFFFSLNMPKSIPVTNTDSHSNSREVKGILL